MASTPVLPPWYAAPAVSLPSQYPRGGVVAANSPDGSVVPVLEPGDIVVMDSLGSHKSAAIRQLIRAAGARLRYLPPYSPDLNPIEQAFARIKLWMRCAQKRTIEDTWRQVGPLVANIEPAECAKYFENAGCASVKT